MIYEFSVPMPYNKENIDRIININLKIKNSKITSLYSSLPMNCDLYTGFEQGRNFTYEHSNFDYWKELFTYVLSKNCDFIYLLNNLKTIDNKDKNIEIQLSKLDKLLKELEKIGIRKLRVAEPQLSTYINKHYKYFEVLASTSLDYKTIWEYQNFIYFHPEVKQIVPSHDINKNFILLKNLRKQYPNIEFELMVNEGCLLGCPHRTIHESISIDRNKIIENNITLSGYYCTSFCNPIVSKFPIPSMVISSIVYPWEIKEYAKLGIKKFKLVGRDAYTDYFNETIENFLTYLLCVDDMQNLSNINFTTFAHHLRNSRILEKLKVEDYINYLPDIRHFKKYGHLCASRCGVECRYCYKCAEKIQKVFEKKQAEQQKRNIPVCYFK